MKQGWRAFANRLTGGMRLALIVPLAALLAAAGGATVPQVTLATPGSSRTGDGTITRFTLRFSDDVVPLGHPPATPPATHDSTPPATARWTATPPWVPDIHPAPPSGTHRPS